MEKSLEESLKISWNTKYIRCVKSNIDRII
jgi:hypothetical protein